MIKFMKKVEMMNMTAYMMIELLELALIIGNIVLTLSLLKKPKGEEEQQGYKDLDLTDIELETWKEIQDILNYDGNLPKDGGTN